MGPAEGETGSLGRGVRGEEEASAQTFEEQSPPPLQCREGPGLWGPDRKALYVPSYEYGRTAQPRTGGRDDDERARKAEKSQSGCPEAASLTPSQNSKTTPLFLTSICWLVSGG